jgi:hypothetical protein
MIPENDSFDNQYDINNKFSKKNIDIVINILDSQDVTYVAKAYLDFILSNDPNFV